MSHNKTWANELWQIKEKPVSPQDIQDYFDSQIGYLSLKEYRDKVTKLSALCDFYSGMTFDELVASYKITRTWMYTILVTTFNNVWSFKNQNKIIKRRELNYEKIAFNHAQRQDFIHKLNQEKKLRLGLRPVQGKSLGASYTAWVDDLNRVYFYEVKNDYRRKP